jgi:hypothetical protein
MSILSNHHVETLAELNGQTEEAQPRPAAEEDWEEYSRWSEQLEKQQDAQDAAATAAKPARKQRRMKQRMFSITFTIDGMAYKVSPLVIDPGVGKKAFRFSKQGGDGEIYDLHADAFGLHCQCIGFEAHGHCKHMETIQAAGKLFDLR